MVWVLWVKTYRDHDPIRTPATGNFIIAPRSLFNKNPSVVHLNNAPGTPTKVSGNLTPDLLPLSNDPSALFNNKPLRTLHAASAGNRHPNMALTIDSDSYIPGTWISAIQHFSNFLIYYAFFVCHFTIITSISLSLICNSKSNTTCLKILQLFSLS